MLLPADLGWDSALLLVALSFGTSFVSATLGLGGGALMLATLANLLPAPAIVPVHGLIQLGSNTGRAWVLRSHVKRSLLLPFAVGSALGAALGGALSIQLPVSALKVVIGSFILWSVFMRIPTPTRRSTLLLGVSSSFLTMFVGATGPFVAAFVKTLGLDRMRHVGTHASLMILQHALKCAVFGILGFSFGSWLPLVAAMIATGFLGTVVGRSVLARLDERLFRWALNAILVLLALRLIIAGGLELLEFA